MERFRPDDPTDIEMTSAEWYQHWCLTSEGDIESERVYVDGGPRYKPPTFLCPSCESRTGHNQSFGCDEGTNLIMFLQCGCKVRIFG